MGNKASDWIMRKPSKARCAGCGKMVHRGMYSSSGLPLCRECHNKRKKR